QADTHRSPRGRSAPHPAPGTSWPRSARPCPPRWAHRAPVPRSPTSSVPLPLLPGAGSSSRRTSDSRACTGSLPGPPRTPQWTPHRPRGALVDLDAPVRLPDDLLRDRKRLRLARRLLLHRQLPFHQARMARPLGSTRITGLLSYHGAVRHCASASVLCPLRVRRLWALPLAVGRSTSTVAFRLRCIGAQLRTFHADA